MDVPRETVLPLRFAEPHSQCLYKESIKCSICGTERDPDLLHLSREEKKGKTSKEREPPSRVEIPEKSESVNTKCTSICKGSPDGLSYSKIVLASIYNEDRPDDEVQHKERQITHGALRNAGSWLVGGHGAVARLIGSCVTCKRLRGPMLDQQMADQPPDRSEVLFPFTNVGIAVFGPWTVQTRRTIGGAANSKGWGLAFLCMASRAIHIELIETMDASSFLCALRRFLAIPGPALRLRCDRRTNFVGAKSEIDDALAETDKDSVANYLSEQGCGGYSPHPMHPTTAEFRSDRQGPSAASSMPCCWS